MLITRKAFMVGTGAALVVGQRLPARAASASPMPAVLGSSERASLAAWCELLVPGAARCGVDRFVDAQLAKPPEQALLQLRYLGWAPPYELFYRQGLAALDQASGQVFGRPFVSLDGAQRAQLLQQLLAQQAPWVSPPPFGLFYTVGRGDGTDVVYGQPAGFARLGMPYRAMIEPPSPW